MQLLSSYPYLVSAIGTLAFLLIVQIVIADVVGILSKHIPGSAVETDHGSLLFRASRVVANTNESIAVFILASAFCVLTNAAPYATGVAAWVYVSARFLYALCYYANQQTMRSIIFGISLLALGGQLIIGLRAWF